MDMFLMMVQDDDTEEWNTEEVVKKANEMFDMLDADGDGEVTEVRLARLPSPVFDNRARGGDYLYSGNETSKLHISAPDHPKIQFSSKYSTPGCPLSNGWCHVVLVYQEGCQNHPSLFSSL